MTETEADTCRRFITPALLAAGWDPDTQIAEQRPVTDGRVEIRSGTPRRATAKRLDYLLRYTRDLPLAVVEAKSSDLPADAGIQQAMDYATKLGVPFAYSSNGIGIVEHDFLTGVERTLSAFPSPDELWYRYKTDRELGDEAAALVTTPYFNDPTRRPRYYQYLSVNRVVEAVAKDQRRILLTLATGTGKSFIAFQICYRLWEARWNVGTEWRRPRILYLADRNVLVDQPRLGVFAPFGDAVHRIEGQPFSVAKCTSPPTSRSRETNSGQASIGSFRRTSLISS